MKDKGVMKRGMRMEEWKGRRRRKKNERMNEVPKRREVVMMVDWRAKEERVNVELDTLNNIIQKYK